MSLDVDLIRQRQQKDHYFKSSAHSPLTPEQRAVFTSLNYFPPNPALAMTLDIEVFESKANVKMLTTTGDTRYYLRYGRVNFEVDGQPTTLTLYFAPGSDQFFVPFMDATSGRESYSAGRYVEAERLTNNRVHLDLNYAYSPYCAYNEPLAMAEVAGREPHIWNCPIPPQENRLSVPIRAGEQTPTGAWVEASGPDVH
jgi:hypothetical protein